MSAGVLLAGGETREPIRRRSCFAIPQARALQFAATSSAVSATVRGSDPPCREGHRAKECAILLPRSGDRSLYLLQQHPYPRTPPPLCLCRGFASSATPSHRSVSGYHQRPAATGHLGRHNTDTKCRAALFDRRREGYGVAELSQTRGEVIARYLY